MSSTLLSILVYQFIVIGQRWFGNTLGSWGEHGSDRTSIARHGFALFSCEGPRQPESSTLLERLADLVPSSISGTQLAQRQSLGILATLSLLRVLRHSTQHRAPARLFASGLPSLRGSVAAEHPLELARDAAQQDDCSLALSGSAELQDVAQERSTLLVS